MVVSEMKGDKSASGLTCLPYKICTDKVDQRGGRKNNTALHGAAEKGDIKGVKLLLAQGADLNAKNNQGQRPVEVTRNQKVRELLEKI